MFDFNIKLSKKSCSEKVIISQPLYYYITFSLICILLLSIIMLYGISVIPLVILVISIIALTYREKWIFQKSNKEITLISGVGLIYSKKKYYFKDIESLEKSSFVKGKRENVEEDKKIPFYMTRFHTFTISFKDGKLFNILTIKDAKKDLLLNIMKEVSTITEINVEA